jgi:hypothetical protein
VHDGLRRRSTVLVRGYISPGDLATLGSGGLRARADISGPTERRRAAPV